MNKEKSAVDRPSKRKFLGFTFYTASEGYDIRIHDKSLKRLKKKIKYVTSRSYSISIDEWTRRRLRMCIWKQWKKPKTKIKNLISFGIQKSKAYEWGNTRKGYWRIANSLFWLEL